jgi:hypothetical protein
VFIGLLSFGCSIGVKHANAQKTPTCESRQLLALGVPTGGIGHTEARQSKPAGEQL